MNAPTFGSILDKPSTEVERPKPLPPGTYLCIVKGQPRQDKSSKKGTEFVEFSLEPQQAADDVDEADLTAALTKADGSVKRLQDMTIRATFYLTEGSLWRLKDFLKEHLGIEEEDKSLRQMIAEAAGRQVMAQVKHVPSDDGKSMFAQLADTAAVE